MKQYIELGKRILAEGELRHDRTGVGAYSVFGANMTFDLRERFPLVTVKETRWKTAFLEMLWFLRGDDTTEFLHAHGCKLWDSWGDQNGNLGPIYGFNWRSWGAKPNNVPQPKPRLRSDLEATYLGVANGSGKANHHLGKTWEGMIARCYDLNSSSYKNYGAKGVHVCDRWLEFAAFAEDVVDLPGYRITCYGEARIVLDKDTIGDGFRYSPETCCWLTDIENSVARAEWLYTVEKDEQRYSFTNVVAFCREHDIEAKNFSDLWTGAKNAQRRNGFRLVGRERIRSQYDQVSNLIDGLKNNPHGRRHIVSAWNVADINHMALPPCHWAHQCYVSNDGHLDMKLFLRSSDFALGLPFNIAQYALLTHLYARAANLKVRRLIVDIGDAHIYTNHVEPMREVLKRPVLSCDGWEKNMAPRDAPYIDMQPCAPTKLIIDTDNIDIDGYKPEHFAVINYEHHDHVPLQVAV